MSESHPGIVFAKVNTEEEQELAGHFQVRSIPTLTVFRQQIIVFSQPGALPPAGLESVIEKVGALDMDEVRRQVAEQAQEQGGNA
jgi:thioredoxin 1